jgi:sec-independent protein translocase protein TatC
VSDSNKSPDEVDGTEQPFVSHLIELRDRLIRVAILYDLLAAPLVAHLPKGATLIATNGDLALHGAAEDPADGGVPAGAAGGAVPGVGLRRAGLYSHEKKLVLPLVVSSTLLFFIGVAFCYFFVFGRCSPSSRASRPRASRRRRTSRPT